MAGISAYYYLTESGRSPVREFVDSLDRKTQRKFFFVKSLLEKFGHKLPEPHAKYLGEAIFELRFKTQEGAVRILYFFFHEDKAILTNGFVKKTGKAPKNERELAVQRRSDFIRRQ
ncbi:MAG: type II toxin-antitoxin system RelE/ParE family toxin [Candidatus Omnitrophica bacterium]|nr:type II toxin-antitoxin system RelE/ParE family toxin [Candidatus Omnitrophota bacterium]